MCCRSGLLTGEEGGGGRKGAESYDGEKACSSTDNLMLSRYMDYTLRNRCGFLKVNKEEMQHSKFVWVKDVCYGRTLNIQANKLGKS